MRLINALKADITFQYRQGFYWVYLILSLVYLVVMSKLPQGNIKTSGIALVVFSDPSVVGFFFIGGIVMLEKIQGVFKYIGITPLSSWEYLCSKAVSLSIVSIVASLAIVLVSHTGTVNLLLLAAGVFLSSAFFTLYGFHAASTSRTINQYFIRVVPYLLIIVFPCFSFFWESAPAIFDIFPSVSGLRLIFGAFSGMPVWRMFLDLGSLLLVTGLVLYIDNRIFLKMMVSEEE